MKKSVFIKILSLVLVMATAVSLASCSAGKAKEDAMNSMMGDSGYNDGSDGDKKAPAGEDYEYGKLIENKWVSTDEEPTSTFSSDVDTASYSRFRAFMENAGGSFKTVRDYYGNSIRTEEMLNYFKYKTNNPKGDDLFGLRAELAPCPWNSEAELLMMTFKAKEVETDNKGNNLVFLIDVSGSMQSSDKLPLLKEAFDYLIDTLDKDDRVSIVTYSGAEKVLLEGCKGSEKEKIRKAVDKLEAGGATNGSAGMEKAYAIAADYFIEGGNNRIIMATDGDLNVGISTTEGILDYVEEKRQSGIYISTLGFGTGGYNDSMLETIADNGNGAYYFVDSKKEAEKIFGTDLFSTLYTVATDVKFQITFDPAEVSEYRLVGYENRVMDNEDFENDAKDAGEVGSGHRLVVCYEIKTTPTFSSVGNIAKLSVRYKDPGEIAAKQNDYDITRAMLDSGEGDDLEFACSVIMTAMLLHKSEYLDEEIDLDFVAEYISKLDLEGDGYKEEFALIMMSAK